MPPIYQGHCSACEAVTPMTSGFYRAVFLDEPSKSSDAHPYEPRLIILAHPVEASILDEIGYTYTTASLGGRLVDVEEVFCQSCGRLFEIRRLTAGLVSSLGCAGFLVCLTLCGATGIAIGLWVGSGLGFVAGCVIVVLMLLAIDLLLGAGVRLWYHQRAKLVETSCRCPGCGCSKVARVGTRKSLPCVACGQPTVRVRSVGMS